jgi:hypothetical protein
MPDATKATVQRGKRLGTRVPDGHEDSALATQQRLSKTVRLRNGAWCAGIAVGSDMSAQGCDKQDCHNVCTQVSVPYLY